MSLEAAIAELTKELRELKDDVRKSNDLNERMIGLKSEAIETVKGTAAKPEAAPKAEKPKAETPKVEEPKAEEPKVEEKKLDPIAQAIADYVGSGYDAADPKAKEERAARGEKVKAIFKVISEKSGVEVKKHTDIPEKFQAAFLKTLAARAAEGNLVIGKDDAADEDLMG
jgi:hypothetical protein